MIIIDNHWVAFASLLSFLVNIEEKFINLHKQFWDKIWASILVCQYLKSLKWNA